MFADQNSCPDGPKNRSHLIEAVSVRRQSTCTGQVSYCRGTPGQPGLPPTLLGVCESHSQRSGTQNMSTEFLQAGNKPLRLLHATITYSPSVAANNSGRRGAKPRADTAK